LQRKQNLVIPFRLLGRQLLAILLTALLGGFLGATLVHMAPGFGVQESDLNMQLSAATRQALHQQDAGERNVLSYYAHYLGGLVHGDLGFSRSMDRPVSELLRDRLPETLRSLAIGVGGGWLLGLALALPATWKRSPCYSTTASVIAGIFMCIPSAVLALLFLVAGSPGKIAIALVVFPKVFRFSRNLLIKTYAMPHVLTAKARGLNRLRILGWHVLPNIAGPMLALAGVTVSIAFGAAIPVEVVCDYPGLGQLAWKAAIARDVPLLVNLTLIIALVTVAANSFSDLVSATATRDVV
jgi:peptide/nickel transport system permease protein